MADDANGAGNTANTATSTTADAAPATTTAPASTTNQVVSTDNSSTTGATNAGTKAPADGAAKTNPAASVNSAKPSPADLAAKAVARPTATPKAAEPPAQQANTPADADKPVTRGELDAYYASKEAEAARNTATISHNATLAQQVETIRAKASDAFQGLPEALRAPLVDSILRKYDDARLNASYPENHPLHGQVCGVLDEAGVNALIQQASDLKSSIRAGLMSQIGQGANAFRPSAGNTASNGAPVANSGRRGSLTEHVGSLVDNLMAANKG